MAHIQHLDDLVKEYLLFRGFSQSLKTFENDLKIDKDKGFRVDRLTDQIMSYIQTYDLQGLRDLWNHFDRRIFTRLSPSMQPYVRKLETSVLRLYVVNTLQTNKVDKLHEFFDKMAPELQTSPEWRDWFVLPYLKGAEDNPTFAMYFSRQWQDTLMVSLTNFLSVVFQNLQLPTLARHEEESEYIRSLQEEAEQLRVRLNAALSATPPAPGGFSLDGVMDDVAPPPPPALLMDDFYSIAQESPGGSEVQMRSFKNFFGFGGGHQPQSSEADRGRQHQQTHAPQAGSDGRRTASQAPSDRRRGRSSSLAAASSRGTLDDKSVAGVQNNTTGSTSSASVTREHPPVQRLGTRRSRSPGRSSSGSIDGSFAKKEPPYSVAKSTTVTSEQTSVVTCVTFSPSGKLLVTGDAAGTVTLYSNLCDSVTSRVAGGEGAVRGSVAALVWLSDADRLLLGAGQPGHLLLYDCLEARPVWETGPDCSPLLKDRRLLCACADPSSARVLLSVAPRASKSQAGISSAQPALLSIDVKTRNVENVHQFGARGTVNCCAVNHNGSLVVCGCSDGCVRIVDLRCLDVIATWPAHTGQVFTVKLSHHQEKLYTIGSDNKLLCWSLTQTGQKMTERALHKQAAGPFMVGGSSRPVLLRPYGALFALTNNDEFILTCSASGTTVYEVRGDTAVVVQELSGHHSDAVVTLDWHGTADGNGEGLLATASLDGSVVVSSLAYGA
ncbi:WD repeat-containing protein 91 [Hyalella azteca]|uniref:WD repeat-containing protein 91 n=1 Tax=Hyalella azteca TaxID=294128 RepID=A0A8B7NYF2_HYAAZ|nr:WD repeat-containing protein 91 [Hyalella azteca]